MIYCNGNNIIQSGDTLRFWAFVTDVNGGYLSNQDVVFYTVKDGVKTQIGSPVVTDSNGIAVCDYVGRGMGDICIMAETEIDGTFVSETLNVWDYVKYDYGTKNNHNDIWSKIQLASEINREDNYTHLSEGEGVYASIKTKIVNQDCIIEVDLKNNSMTGWIIGVLQESTQLTGFGLLSASYTEWTHLKVVIEGTTIKAYYNNETNPTTTRTGMVRDTSKPLYVNLMTPQTITYVDFKDFKVYPL